MNKKNRKLKSRLRVAEGMAEVRQEVILRQSARIAKQAADLVKAQRVVHILHQHAEYDADNYQRELARYAFIDKVLRRVGDTHARLPFFQYMLEGFHTVPPDYQKSFPPMIRRTRIPEILFKPSYEQESMVDRMAQVLEYALFDYSDTEEFAVTYECNGKRRSYVLPSAIAKLPEDLALDVVIREVAPAILAMIRGAK